PARASVYHESVARTLKRWTENASRGRKNVGANRGCERRIVRNDDLAGLFGDAHAGERDVGRRVSRGGKSVGDDAVDDPPSVLEFAIALRWPLCSPFSHLRQKIARGPRPTVACATFTYSSHELVQPVGSPT